MQYEKVHSVWHFHDRARSGIADYNGAPHYFVSPFDDAADYYADYFLLYPIDQDVFDQCLRHDAIFRSWVTKFSAGRAAEETHPGLGDNDPDFRVLGEWLDRKVSSLNPLPSKHEGRFREAPDQAMLPLGFMRELEVCWRAKPD